MDEVRRQLIGFDRRKIIRKWHDGGIPPGTEWDGQIKRSLLHADIILLFVSPYFLESDYCYDAEMAVAMRRSEPARLSRPLFPAAAFPSRRAAVAPVAELGVVRTEECRTYGRQSEIVSY